MMPGTPSTRPPEWLPEKDQHQPEKPNLAVKFALWDMRTKFFLTIWYRVCFFMLSGLGVIALFMVIWSPHELSPTIELIDPIIPDGSNLVIPSIFLVAAAYASRIIGKFIAHRYQKEE